MKKYIKPITYCHSIQLESLMVTASLPVVDHGEKIEDENQVLSKKNNQRFDLWGDDED